MFLAVNLLLFDFWAHHLAPTVIDNHWLNLPSSPRIFFLSPANTSKRLVWRRGHFRHKYSEHWRHWSTKLWKVFINSNAQDLLSRKDCKVSCWYSSDAVSSIMTTAPWLYKWGNTRFLTMHHLSLYLVVTQSISSTFTEDGVNLRNYH